MSRNSDIYKTVPSYEDIGYVKGYKLQKFISFIYGEEIIPVISDSQDGIKKQYF